jgi:hypothetical protein
VRVATSVLADVQDSQNGGVKACLRRSCATGWDGDWRGGNGSLPGWLWELDYITNFIAFGMGPARVERAIFSP